LFFGALQIKELYRRRYISYGEMILCSSLLTHSRLHLYGGTGPTRTELLLCRNIISQAVLFILLFSADQRKQIQGYR